MTLEDKARLAMPESGLVSKLGVFLSSSTSYGVERESIYCSDLVTYTKWQGIRSRGFWIPGGGGQGGFRLIYQIELSSPPLLMLHLLLTYHT